MDPLFCDLTLMVPKLRRTHSRHLTGKSDRCCHHFLLWWPIQDSPGVGPTTDRRHYRRPLGNTHGGVVLSWFSGYLAQSEIIRTPRVYSAPKCYHAFLIDRTARLDPEAHYGIEIRQMLLLTILAKSRIDFQFKAQTPLEDRAFETCRDLGVRQTIL